MKLLLFILSTLMISSAFARGGSGGHSLGIGLGLATPSQDDLNNHIGTYNTQTGNNVEKFGTAMEYYLSYGYRFSGTMFAMVLRPTYFTQSAKGSGSTYSLTGYSFFPMLRIIPLENGFIKFFMQTGVGYGKLSGKMEQAGNGSQEFSGGAFGAMAGLGAEFCFTDSHCMTLEGNFRYLPIERNIITSSSLGATNNGNVTNTGSQELEYNGNDLKTTMSGIQGVIGYVMNF